MWWKWKWHVLVATSQRRIILISSALSLPRTRTHLLPLPQDDEEGLDDALDKAKSLDVSEHVLEVGAKCKAEVESRKEFNRKMTALLDDDDRDKDALAAMIEEARELGIKGGKVEQATQVRWREVRAVNECTHTGSACAG